MSRTVGVGVGVIGLGFMGRTHLEAYAKARAAGFANRIVAVADRDVARLRADAQAGGNLATTSGTPLFDATTTHTYATPDELLRDPDVELVSICTHTDTHVDLAIRALEAGKHVLVEKPLALTAAAIRPLTEAARKAKTLCMPAHCMRFWPAWEWLKHRIDDHSFGAVRSAVFQRLGSGPAWSREFYADDAKTGGALVDLHLHDTDFIRHCFGDPDEVIATGSIHHVSTLYRYAKGPKHVLAEGGWDHSPGFPFRMRYVVVFEQATADFDLTRTPALQLARDGKCEPVEMPDTNGYDGEVRHLLAAIATGTRELRVTVEDAERTALVLERERVGMGKVEETDREG